MRYSKILIFLIFLLSAGCMQAVQTERLGEYEDIPRQGYDSYYYSSGVGERLRTVLLVSHGSNVEIVPYSAGILTTTGTFDDAMAFMQGEGDYQIVDVQRVTYRGGTIGYLLTYPPFSAYYNTLVRETLEVNLFERGGKIYFSVWERSYEKGILVR